jgi:hypothetical protein
VHLYAEVFDPNYPTNGSTAPGYAVAEVDKMVQITRTNGLYLIMTIGNGANNGNHTFRWATNFWNFYAARYANETHVLFEIHNEPMADHHLTRTTRRGRSIWKSPPTEPSAQAPNTPVLFQLRRVRAMVGKRHRRHPCFQLPFSEIRTRCGPTRLWRFMDTALGRNHHGCDGAA